MDQDDESLFAEMLGHMSQAEIEALAAMDLDGETTSPTKKKRVVKKKAAGSVKPKVKKSKPTATTASSSSAQPHTVSDDLNDKDEDDEAEDDFVDDLSEVDRVPTSHKQSMRWGGTYTNLKDVFAGVVPADAWASGSAEMVSEALANLSIVNLTNHYSLPDTDLLMCLGKVTHLYLQGNGCIVDLSGLVVLVSLRVISVAGNKVTSLEPLSTLDTLLLLDASDNQIEELDVGRDLPAGLQSLDLRGNPCAPLYENAKEDEITEEDIEYMHQYTDQVRTFCPKIRFLDGKTLTPSLNADDDEDGMEATGFLLNSIQNAAENGDDEMDPEMTRLREEIGNDEEDDAHSGHVQSSAMARRQKQLLGELLNGGTAGGNATTGHSYLAPDREEGSDDDSTDDDGNVDHPNETAKEAISRHQNRRDVVEDGDMERYQQRCGRVRRELDILQSHNGRAARLNLDNFWDSTMKSIDQLRGQVASRRTHVGLPTDDSSTSTTTRPSVGNAGGGSGLNATPPGSPVRQQRRTSGEASSALEPSAMYKKALELLSKEIGGAAKLEELRKRDASNAKK